MTTPIYDATKDIGRHDPGGNLTVTVYALVPPDAGPPWEVRHDCDGGVTVVYRFVTAAPPHQRVSDE